MVTRGVALSCLLVFALASASQAEADDARPRIGLVLGGGGARGAAHVGVLKVLEEMRIPLHCVVGTSMGSIVGGLYASGISPDRIEQLLTTVDWNELLDDAPTRDALSFPRKQEDNDGLFAVEFGVRPDGLKLPAGLVSGWKITRLLQTLTLSTVDADSFDDLPIPFRSVACDLDTGEMVVLSDGSLGDAMRASMSVAGAFSPVELDGRLLVDGGVVRNLPVDVARDLGADVIIAVDVSSVSGDWEHDSVIAVYSRNIGIMTRQNTLAAIKTLTSGDVLIVPELGKMSTVDFGFSGEAIAKGDTAARARSAELSAYTIGEEAYDRYLQELRCGTECPEKSLTIDEVRVTGTSRVSHRIIERTMNTKAGAPLDVKVLSRDLDRIYDLGDFESVGFDIMKEGRRHVLVIKAEDKSWGPTYLRLGLNISADFRGSSKNDFHTYLRTARINKLGAEWTTRTSLGSVNEIRTGLYQPLDYGGVLFVNPQVRLERRDAKVTTEQDVESVYRVRTQEASVHAGMQFGTYGEVRVGAFRGHVSTGPRLGPAEAGTDHGTGGWTARLTFDGMDATSFATSGGLLMVDGVFHRERFGSASSFHRVRAEGRGALTFGRQTVTAACAAGSSFDSDLPAYDEFELGGFLSLSGLEPGQIRGPNFGLVDLIYMNEISKLPVAIGAGIYAGASIEVGNVWRNMDDITFEDLRVGGSVFVGADSVLGPVYVAVGWADRGNASVILSLGGPTNPL